MNRNQAVGTFLFIIRIAWNYNALAVFLMNPRGTLNRCLTTVTATFGIPVIITTVRVYFSEINIKKYLPSQMIEMLCYL